MIDDEAAVKVVQSREAPKYKVQTEQWVVGVFFMFCDCLFVNFVNSCILINFYSNLNLITNLIAHLLIMWSVQVSSQHSWNIF